VALGERLQDRFAAGTVFVPLAAVTDPGLVLASVARAVGADLGGAGSPLQALAEWLGDDQWLLILDSVEAISWTLNLAPVRRIVAASHPARGSAGRRCLHCRRSAIYVHGRGRARMRQRLFQWPGQV
jgi:hypothetical protein